MAGWKNFRSMITGFDVFPVEKTETVIPEKK
jgi:hypothetical protein